MKKATLVICRHGQTEWNKIKVMTGQADIPLTEVGEEQAREIGRLLKVYTFDKVYSSTLSRAFNTASLALKEAGFDLPIEQRGEIVEHNAGDFTGRNHKTDPEIIAYPKDFDVRMPGGESNKDVMERIMRFFDAEVMPRLKNGENVLIVAHAGVLRAFDLALREQDTSQPRHRIPNATPHVYEYEDGVLVNFYRIDNPKETEAANENVPQQKKKHPKL